MALLLAYVFAYIGNSTGIFPVQLNSGGKAVAPLGQIIHGMPLLVLMPAVHSFYTVCEKPVEMPSPVFVLLRNKDIRKAMPLNHVAAPLIEPLCDGFAIIAVNLFFVQGQGHEPLEVVRQRKPPQIGSGSAHTPQGILAICFCPLFSLRSRRGQLAGVGIILRGLPPLRGERLLSGANDIHFPTGVSVQNRIAEQCFVRHSSHVIPCALTE